MNVHIAIIYILTKIQENNIQEVIQNIKYEKCGVFIHNLFDKCKI